MIEMLDIIHFQQVSDNNIGKSKTELNIALIHETFKTCCKKISGLK